MYMEQKMKTHKDTYTPTNGQSRNEKEAGREKQTRQKM